MEVKSQASAAGETRRNLTRVDTARITIAPSILAADFARLGAEIEAVAAAGADVIHVDIMDGHFVPNLSIGPAVVAAVRGTTKLPFDVHLMLSEPLRYAKSFVKAGADHLTFHVEAVADVPAAVGRLRDLGCSVGLSLKPATPPEAIFPYLELIDLVLVMTVEPGFGGQSFMADQMPKLRALRQRIDAIGRAVHLEVDGGIAPDTAPVARAAGARMLVAGTSVFRSPDGMAAAMNALRG